MHIPCSRTGVDPSQNLPSRAVICPVAGVGVLPNDCVFAPGLGFHGVPAGAPDRPAPDMDETFAGCAGAMSTSPDPGRTCTEPMELVWARWARPEACPGNPLPAQAEAPVPTTATASARLTALNGRSRGPRFTVRTWRPFVLPVRNGNVIVVVSRFVR